MINKHIFRRLAIVACAATGAIIAHALPLSTYSPQSKLAQGHWVKISVPESGLYKITRQQLSQWGFDDISRVRVYGYGGQRIADRLTAANYVDDLPIVQSVAISDGVVFYGMGPEKWVVSNKNFWHCENNIYSTAGYYFISDTAEDIPQIQQQGQPQAVQPVDYFIDRLHHEVDNFSPGEAGYILVGENLKVQNNRELIFNMPGRVADTDAWFECAVVAKNYSSSFLSFSANGQKLDQVASDKISAINNTHYLHAGYTVTTHTVPQQGEQLKLNVGVLDISAMINAWIDYVSVNYTRKLALPSEGYLNFNSSSSMLSLNVGSNSNVRVWDVTDPMKITSLNTGADNGSLVWSNDYTGSRVYTAWSENARMPAPAYVGTVANQNIHGLDNVDMVIFTLPEYKAQAQRIAQIHENEAVPLKVAVLGVDEVYNEFASGAADVSALRKCLKMFYDRGLASESKSTVRYALLMGRSTYDNRHLTSQFNGASAYNTIPYWMTGSQRAQFSDNDAFGTDDFIAMLKDNSGTNPGLDDLCVAVGRMPVTSVSEAKAAVDKLEKYVNESRQGNWKNSFLFLADDGDSGIHLEQAEGMIKCLQETPNQQNFITKVYIDAYDIIGGVCEGGRKDMYRMLDEGIVWWGFCGHANNHSWTGERIFTYNDINNLYLKNVPILMAATCDFLRWDSNTISGGEILFHEPNGGTIATISATRPVYISDNGLFTKAMGRAIAKREPDGSLPRLGDIYRNAKNNILSENGEHRSNANRLRYVLMGDPAMSLATPDNIVKLEKIGDAPVILDDQITLQALQRTKISGSICTPQGRIIDDFNGTIYVNIYDAEKSITTKGVRNDNVKITFEQHGDKLFVGTGVVKDGRFEVTVSMPGEVADNFRPAMINMYACSADKKIEAVGVNSDFYVYGLDESVAPDVVPPVIESFVLNEPGFNDGDNVNTSPLVIANISDDVSINLSAAGIGHQMVLTLDGNVTYTDVSMYYQPAVDGSTGGVISYPLSNLTPGEHTLALKVWDTAANSAAKKITFNVVEGLTPTLYKVYTDVNPARTEVKFYIEHNRPESELTASVTVYDLLGRKLWETTTKVPSDMNTTYPITWDLCDSSGRRVPRGIYLYRATISADNGDTYDTDTRRLAITAP